MPRRKIAIVTGTRAEYGLLYWLLKEIQADAALELQLIVTGAHLSPLFGSTYQEIEKDGFFIAEKVDMQLSGDSAVDIARSMGIATIGFAEAYSRLNPDILVFVGDRYEILAAAQAAMVARIPMAHIHGGEVTEGTFDDAIRHSLTKMSHFHFVAAEEYKNRVIQLGEDPGRVFNVGALALDNVANETLLSRKDLEDFIGFKMGGINFLVTYHPVTLDVAGGGGGGLDGLLEALDQFPQAHIIFTKPNADPRHTFIQESLEKYVGRNPQRTLLVSSLGRIGYLSAIKHCDVVIGNSSSGLIEAPALNKPTVNVGERQKGRLRASSVIDCCAQSGEIMIAIKKALSHDFKKGLKNVHCPYGVPGASARIKNILTTISLADILRKKFYDVSFML